VDDFDMSSDKNMPPRTRMACLSLFSNLSRKMVPYSNAHPDEHGGRCDRSGEFPDKRKAQDVAGRGELERDGVATVQQRHDRYTVLSVFFGGSSPTFQAKKDETIRFSDFKIYEGECMPSDAPSPLSSDQPVVHLDPTWATMRPLVDTDLQTTTVFSKPYVGGGCGEIIVTNTGARCDRWQIEISIRPEWGSLVKWAGLILLDSETESGWSSLGPDTAKVTDTALKTKNASKGEDMRDVDTESVFTRTIQ
jgi:hypothetical protein